MKKLFILFAVVTLASCNKKTELGPEYATPAEISDVIFPVVINADEEVVVTAKLTSEYPLGNAFVYYWINDDLEKAKDVSVQSYAQTPQFNANYSGKIPGQPAGTKVSFQVACMTFYYVLKATEVYTYTVHEPTVPQQ